MSPYRELHQQNLERDEIEFNYVWLDRPLSFDLDFEKNDESRNAGGGSTESNFEIGNVTLPDWVQNIESELQIKSKNSQRSRSASYLEVEVGHQTLLRLVSLRVGRVVERRRILRGYLDTVVSEGLLNQIRAPCLYWLLISTEYGRILRENHGFGYHYHYSRRR